MYLKLLLAANISACRLGKALRRASKTKNGWIETLGSVLGFPSELSKIKAVKHGCNLQVPIKAML